MKISIPIYLFIINSCCKSCCLTFSKESVSLVLCSWSISVRDLATLVRFESREKLFLGCHFFKLQEFWLVQLNVLRGRERGGRVFTSHHYVCHVVRQNTDIHSSSSVSPCVSGLSVFVRRLLVPPGSVENEWIPISLQRSISQCTWNTTGITVTVWTHTWTDSSTSIDHQRH